MKYEANIYQMAVDNHSFWVAESKLLKGCVGQGDASEDAIQELEENEVEWIETAKECGISLNQYINDAIADYNAVCRTKSTIPSAPGC